MRGVGKRAASRLTRGLVLSASAPPNPCHLPYPLSYTRFHLPAVTYPLSPTRCHLPLIIYPLSLTDCLLHAIQVLGADESQRQLYSEASPAVTSVLQGQYVCIMAYGQTGEQ